MDQIEWIARAISSLTVQERMRLWRRLSELDSGEEEGRAGVREPVEPDPPAGGAAIILTAPPWPKDIPDPAA